MKTGIRVRAVLPCALALLLYGCAEPAEKPDVLARAGESTIMMSDGTENAATAFRLAPDRIGVRLGDDAPDLKSILAGRVAIREIERYEGNVRIATMVVPLSRSALLDLAYALEVEDNGVSHAGIVVFPKDSERPLIATNSLVVQFDPDVPDADVDRQLADLELERIAENPFVKGRQLLVRVKPSGERDAFGVELELKALPEVQFSHPNFLYVDDYRQFVPNDPLFPGQWHHANNGASGGTVDADGDTDFAWTVTRGAAATTIAVIDSGFDMAHEDLTPNLPLNAGETPGNGIDDDGNGCVDDVNGCTFATLVVCGSATCGVGAITAADHGTAVAGVAAARGNNGRGVSGSCPSCTVIPVQRGNTTFTDGLAIGYAGAIGADVVTNSWGYASVPANVTNAINAAAANGAVIFWAMNNGNLDDCVGGDISANANAIAISASSNQDRKVTESAFGNCMELLAPTHRGYGGSTPFTGTLNITTTDRTGAPGYNDASPVGAACPGELGSANDDYTACFRGTSSATPYAAGIAGLMLSADATLTRQQVQRSMQDTADKIEDSAGRYDVDTGFSGSASTGVATHGYGRVNAFEAVRLVAPATAGGRNNVDVFIRDNRLDWGNTEQPSNVLMEPTRGFIPHYRSVDIKIDAGPTFEPSPPATSVQFDAFVDEEPTSGVINKVYVRVHNRGASAASDVSVKLQWAFAGTALPSLPPDYWTLFPADSSHPANRWNSLGTQVVPDLPYSGASVAGTAADGSRIVAFDFPGPPIDATLAAFRHHCLLAVLSSPQDPVSSDSMTRFSPDVITPRDNNVTHKNVSVQDPLRSGRARAAFYVRNPFATPIATQLRFVGPRGWKATLDGLALDRTFTLEAGDEKLVVAEFFAPGENAVGEVEIRQSVLTPELVKLHGPPGGKAFDLGGVIYRFGTGSARREVDQDVPRPGSDAPVRRREDD